MIYQPRALLAAALLLLGATASSGQSSPPAPPRCEPSTLEDPEKLAKTSLVIDVRPDQVNQFKGKYSFREQAHIALINMNPFLFSYRIKVDQTEIQDTGFLNFLNLLGSPVTDLIGSPASVGKSLSFRETAGGSLEHLKERTKGPATLASSCKIADDPEGTKALMAEAQGALDELQSLRDKVIAKQEEAKRELDRLNGQYEDERNAFNAKKGTIFNSSTEAQPLCEAARDLYTSLSGKAYPNVKTLTDLKQRVADLRSLTAELRSSAEGYKSEYESCPARARGLSYPDSLIRLAVEIDALGAAYETQVTNLTNETKGYDALQDTIARLETDVQDPDDPKKKMRVNLTLQRQYTVFGRYDISALDIAVTPEPLGPDAGLPVRRDLRDPRFDLDVVGRIQSAGGAPSQGNVRIVNAGLNDFRSLAVLEPHRARAASAGGEGGGGGDGGGGNGGGEGGGAAADDGGKTIRTSGTIGDRRFEVSGGMVFSSLRKREFQPVLGYARNEQGEIVGEDGNPTDARNLTSIVGVSEDSGRRISPIGMLHYRLPYLRNVFASVGVTGKRDDAGVDLEYLIGPSVLYRSMFFTVGGYAGKQQRLAGDLFLGAPLEGDSVPVRKDYRWGLGFSFTYKIPLGENKSEK